MRIKPDFHLLTLRSDGLIIDSINHPFGNKCYRLNGLTEYIYDINVCDAATKLIKRKPHE